MTTELVAPSPLRALAPGVFALEGSIRLLPGARLPLRSLVLQGPGRELALISPPAMGPAELAAVRALGEVRHLIAPNALHHLFLGQAMEAFPEARVWGPAALATKRPDLRFHEVLEEGQGPWPGELGVHPLRGAPAFAESALVHRPSDTLFLTDLVFHVRAPGPGGWLTPWMLRLTGTWDRLASSRAWRLAVKDRAAFAESLEALLADPDWSRVVPAHGEVLEEGRAGLRQALGGWLEG